MSVVKKFRITKIKNSNPITCPFEISIDILSKMRWFFLNDKEIFFNEIKGLLFLILVILNFFTTDILLF